MTARAGEKKHGAVFPPCVQLQVLLTGPAAMIVVALRAEDCFKKKALNRGEKNTPFAHY